MDRFNLDYVETMLGQLSGVKTALDVGALDVNGSPRELVAKAGIEFTGADLESGQGVDVVIDITAAFDEVERAFAARRFDLVMSLNTLEHIFEPLKALDNMLSLVADGGYLLIVAPLVWELHDWPYDFYRLTPDFFKKYAQTRNAAILEGSLLLSARDTRRFSDDLKVLPEAFPSKRLPRVGRFLYTALRRFVAPGLKECWPRTSVNVTFQKQP